MAARESLYGARNLSADEHRGDPDNVEIYFFAPGLDPKSVEVSAQRNVLTISGERQVSARTRRPGSARNALKARSGA
jgi:HSP20 family molecular chaperone IbpA